MGAALAATVMVADSELVVAELRLRVTPGMTPVTWLEADDAGMPLILNSAREPVGPIVIRSVVGSLESVNNWIVVAPAWLAVMVRYEPWEVVRMDAVTPALAALMAASRPSRLLVWLVSVMGTGAPPATRYSVSLPVGATVVDVGSATPLVMVAEESEAREVTSLIV